jgi:hypothetical protein
LYALKHGKAEQGIIQQCIRERTKFPDFIQNAPELQPGLSLYYVAFWDLNGCRGGMGGPIMWTAVEQYALAYDLDQEQREALHYHVRQMDVAANEFQEAKNGNG